MSIKSTIAAVEIMKIAQLTKSIIEKVSFNNSVSFCGTRYRSSVLTLYCMYHKNSNNAEKSRNQFFRYKKGEKMA